MKMPDGDVYKLCILRVEGTYDDLPLVNGTEVPAELTYIDEERTVEMSNGVRFVTAYLPECVFGQQKLEKQT